MPELSNIVVAYNHLKGSVPYTATHTIECSLISNYNPDPSYSDGDSCQDHFDLPVEYDMVLAGTPLGQTGGGPSEYFDHLHLAVFFARGFARANIGENAFYINPLMLYSKSVAQQHVWQSYYPFTSNGKDTSLGIVENELHQWSAGGFNNKPHGNISFWDVQTATPAPGHVEWPLDNYPLIPANDPELITDVSEFLAARYNAQPYEPVDCILEYDISRVPTRIIADCDLSDLYDESSYSPPIPH